MNNVHIGLGLLTLLMAVMPGLTRPFETMCSEQL